MNTVTASDGNDDGERPAIKPQRMAIPRIFVSTGITLYCIDILLPSATADHRMHHHHRLLHHENHHRPRHLRRYYHGL